MKIAAPCVLSLSWTLSDTTGNVIDELAEPVEHAFGDYRSELVCFEARELFPEKLETGMHFEGPPEGSVTPDMPADVLYAVTEIYPSHVVLDGNHPLAGMALRLKLKVRDVREASEDEIAAGTLGTAGITLLNTAPPGPSTH
jgi:FKBP-type peptidyl-prolyl cis-trans isomerase SlyD